MTSEMQIRGVPVEAVDLDDFVSPSTSRPRRSVPRKDYLAMLDANKRLKHEYTATSPKKPTPQKISGTSKNTTETQVSKLQDEADEQLKTWRILVKHNLISQVNKQICGEKNTSESRNQGENNNDENSRMNTRSGSKRVNNLLSLNEKPTTQKNMFNIKSDQVQSIFDHIKWLRNSEEVKHSKILENSTTHHQPETKSLAIKDENPVENKNLFDFHTFLEKNDTLNSSINTNKCESDVSYGTDQILKVEVHISNHYNAVESSLHSTCSESQKVGDQAQEETHVSKDANTCTDLTETVKQKLNWGTFEKPKQLNLKKKRSQKEPRKQKNVQVKSDQNGVSKKECNTGKKLIVTRRRRNSPDTRVRNFQCTYCCKKFLTQGHLNAHTMTHTGIKPFECNICKKRFSQIGNLQNHLSRIHLGEKNYDCRYCGRKFTEQSNVQRHEKYVHDFNRKYECDVCNYRFKTKNLLKKHLDVIHIYKMLKCNLCNKKCKVLPSLHKYIVKNKKEETFKCDKCKKNSI